MDEEIILPFTIYSGHEFVMAEGLAKLRPGGVLLEFEARDSFLGIVRMGLRKIDIPLDAIASVEVRQSWWQTAVVLRVKTLEVIKEIPGYRHGEIALRVRRKDRREAERFVAMLEGYLTEAALERIEREGETKG